MALALAAVMMTSIELPPAPARVTLSTVLDARGFDQLKSAWIALQSATPDSSIFLAWDWQRLWWKHYGEDRQLCIVVARHAHRVVGLLPLYLETHRKARGLFKARKLRQVGVGGDTAPDDLGALLLPDFQQETCAAMSRFVARELRQWDMLDWTDLPSASPLAVTAPDALQAAGFRVQCSLAEPITCGPLPGDWETYRKGLSRNRRETLSRKRRRFEALPGARMRLVESAAELTPAFERLVELHQLRWTGRTEQPAFSTPQYQGFHRELMHALLAQGQLRLLSLEVEGKAIAMLYGMQYKGRFCFFQSGFDPAHAQHSPGDVLMGYAVELAIAQGCEVFDMLKGDHAYKRHFVQESRRNLEIRAFRPGPVDLAYRARDALSQAFAGRRKADDREAPGRQQCAPDSHAGGEPSTTPQ